ncbi:RNA 2',3'-cyclic phosphodiesterase [Wenzhouxiangella sp. AB-CW3]|uniref:RNA 2',3'-cyclic phosphodiesterase n=1 Tax=Wenzhouxiangella sp. AB-CW3 TaxID=2771012 RepID=UPI00168BBEF0|nr:RNA 2',3'-cyclic phosphodiesterase [Wenzhouxiangella sp. AB-CW3]QOC21533.1 RNA 2',3'-cyclic phosphodiesterase [Wenzhouxiangella sp. AB-CW3]
MSQSHDFSRLFFALWPDEEVRAGIVARRECLGQVSRRRVPDHNLHLTLLFLGNQPADRVAAIKEAAGDVTAAGCKLRLDRIGWFPRPRVAWLGGDAPTPLSTLVDDLKSAMSTLDLVFDDRPFRPHVTLFRQVRRRPPCPDFEPLDWPVSEFALVESKAGHPYEKLKSWPLKGSAINDSQ